MKGLFAYCNNVAKFPDLSGWNTFKVVDLSYMFYDCTLMQESPGVENWAVKNVKTRKCMFQYCNLLVGPDQKRNLECVQC